MKIKPRLLLTAIIILAVLLTLYSNHLNSPQKKAERVERDTAPTRADADDSPPFRLKGPGVPNEYMYMQRAFKDGTINLQAKQEAIVQARAVRNQGGLNATRAAVGVWEQKGPVNVGGRITDIAGDPSNSNKFYVGVASGGVWKTTDGGATFVSIFDGYGSLAIGALAIDPTDSDVLYVGTGEANPGGGSVGYPGDGVWKTTDGGQTWAHLGLEQTRYIGRVAVDPDNPSTVFVAATGNLFSRNVERGLYRSKNGGATWEKVLYVSDIAGAVDVAIDPATPSRIYAAMWERIRLPNTRAYGGPGSGIWRSEDGGDNWTHLTSGLPSSASEPGRIGIAIAPSSPSTVYALYADKTGNFEGFYRSTNYGDSWSQRSASGLSSSSFYSTYGWWFGRIFVHPTNTNQVWAHGIRLYRSTDGGSSFSTIGNSMHVDHHAQWFYPANPNIILEGNDGGVYRSTNGGSTWTHFENLPISQFYTIEVHPSQPYKIYGGLQDNGTQRTRTGQLDDWESIYGGDGFVVNVDPNNTNVIYAESQYGALGRSTNGGSSFSSATSGISGRTNWNTPVVIDPSSTGSGLETTMYYGANRLYRSTNSASSWTAISGDLTDGDGGSNGVVYGTLTTIAVAPSDRNTLYVGTDDGNVWVTTNLGGNYTNISSGLPDRWVTRVAVDPYDAAIAYVTLSGFRRDDPLPHVFRTVNHGASWTDVSSNLPDAPVNDIVVDPRDTSTLYVATDVGVFVSYDLGGSWATLGSGLPEVIVCDIKYIDGSTPTLYAATFGRSTYTIELSESPPVTPTPSPTPTPVPGEVIFLDDFESDQGWIVNPAGTDTATTGMWERGNPEGTDYNGPKQLDNTVSGVYDLVTGPLAGSSVGTYDIDSGVTSIRSPNIALPTGGEITLSFSYYLAHTDNASGDDFLRVRVVGTSTSTVFEELGAADNDDATWQTFSGSLNAFAGQTIYLLIEAADNAGGSIVEAAIDDVAVLGTEPPPTPTNTPVPPTDTPIPPTDTPQPPTATPTGAPPTDTPTPAPPTATPTSAPPTDTPTPPPGGEVFFDDFESDQGWATNPSGTDTATTGMWERADPEETTYSGTTYQLGTTVSGVYNLVTGGAAGSSVGSYDIDGGVTTIRSPDISLPSNGDITLSFQYYLAHYSNGSSDDFLRLKVVGATTQTVFEELGAGDIDGASWQTFSGSLNAFAGQTIYLLIEAADNAGGSIVEAAIDDVRVTSSGPLPTDTPSPPTNTPVPTDPPTDTPVPPTDTPEPPTPTPGTGPIFFDDFESDQGWTANPNGSDTATTGIWERANPEETTYSGVTYQLDVAVSGVYDLVTGPLAGSGAGSYDIDGGLTSIRSPDISLPNGSGITLSFQYYLAHYSNASADDYLRVRVVGATTVTVFEELGAGDTDGASWQSFSTSLDTFAGQTIYLLIEAADAGSGSLVEAAIDDVRIE